MFWRKKKEAEKVGQVTIPPFLFEPKQKAEYKEMNAIIFDAEKYERRGQIETRNALLIELKNQIDRVLESPPPKPSPIQEGRTKSNVKKKTSEGRQAPPPPPPPPPRLIKEGKEPPKPPTFPKDRTTKRN